MMAEWFIARIQQKVKYYCVRGKQKHDVVEVNLLVMSIYTQKTHEVPLTNEKARELALAGIPLDSIEV